MLLLLPNIEYKELGWTMQGQIRKICEEVGEVAEALVTGDLDTITRETLDAIQTCHTMLLAVSDEWEGVYGTKFPLDYYTQEHWNKLLERGYIHDDYQGGRSGNEVLDV